MKGDLFCFHHKINKSKDQNKYYKLDGKFFDTFRFLYLALKLYYIDCKSFNIIHIMAKDSYSNNN